MSDASHVDPSSLDAFNLPLSEIEERVAAVAAKHPRDSDIGELAGALRGLTRLFSDVVKRPPWLRL